MTRRVAQGTLGVGPPGAWVEPVGTGRMTRRNLPQSRDYDGPLLLPPRDVRRWPAGAGPGVPEGGSGCEGRVCRASGLGWGRPGLPRPLSLPPCTGSLPPTPRGVVVESLGPYVPEDVDVGPAGCH